MEKLFNELSLKYSLNQIFNDFLEISALALNNNIVKDDLEKREARYLEITDKYTKEEIVKFSNILALLAIELERNPRDVLGEMLMKLEEGNKQKGQYFTPFHICEMQAKIMLDKKYSNAKEIELIEPSCGGGALIIAYYNALKEKGINPQKVLRVKARDLDLKSVFMCYIQLTLLGVNCEIEHTNALNMDVFCRFRNLILS